MAKEKALRNGLSITLRSPAEKEKRYAEELKKRKVLATNKFLTQEEKAFRLGYLACRRDKKLIIRIKGL